MTNLKKQFQEEKNLSFNDIPINGVHLEYINWLEERIESLSIANVVGQREQLCQCQSVDEITEVENWCRHCEKKRC